MSAADKRSLEQRLAKLLCISIDDDRDYVIDVLDSLIDIGDPSDVAEYLSSFIAAGDEDNDEGGTLQTFAQDVQKFSNGETLSSSATEVTPNEKLPAVKEAAVPKTKIWDEAAVQREEIKRREIEARERQREEQFRLKQKKEEEERERRREAAAAAAMAKKEKQAEAAAAASARRKKVKKPPPPAAAADIKQKQSKGGGTTTNQSLRAVSTNKKSLPTDNPQFKLEGKPKGKCCGCFGSKHKPLANCLRCGRISCEVEGINDYCHFCGYWIGDYSSTIATTGDEKMDSALKHKERLLEFDKTSAARTHIHDDQEDYFVTSTNMWATKEEQEDARELEEVRRKKLQRQQQVLNINF
mmetsp:Transcript_9831/g.15763  ORF Transcript_9831/g.15763 Transcript_9831/m.15763 type:complete len:355 (+) Transcript_9831:75-1139(+)